MHRCLVGPSLWDGAGVEPAERSSSPGGADVYRSALEARLAEFRGLFDAAELSQQADYQQKDVESWSRLELMGVANVPAFLLENRRLGLHLRHANVDVADHETPTHRLRSVAEAKRGLEFAFRLGADVAVLHPGTFNERSGRFWPKADELPELLRQRSTALEQSLAELAGALVGLAAERERRLRAFEHEQAGLFGDLRSLLSELRREERAEERIRLLARALALLASGKLTPEQVRHCQQPWRGLHLCLENLEPPNFLACTPDQLGKLHSKLSEFYEEAASHAGLDAASIDRYRPKLSIDPGHMLNAKIILTQPANAAFLEKLEGGEAFFLDFVNLPGEFPVAGAGAVSEPLLNRFVRLHDGDLAWVHLYGCQRMDTCMTTHGPVKAFRTKAMAASGPDGAPEVRYDTGAYRPSEELNLEEVVQVLGAALPYVVEVFDAPVEVLKASVMYVSHYLDWLSDESRRAADRIRVSLGREAEAAGTSTARRAQLQAVAAALVGARAYVRPRRGEGYWSIGYDEVGFYRFADDPAAGNVDIFATIKQADGRVWLKGTPVG